jgi:hypothetical protein
MRSLMDTPQLSKYRNACPAAIVWICDLGATQAPIPAPVDQSAPLEPKNMRVKKT